MEENKKLKIFHLINKNEWCIQMQTKFVLLLIILCGLRAKCQDFIFTEPSTITELSAQNTSNTSYLIKAPIGQKIELTINSFRFVPCQLERSNLLVQKTNEACLDNHHIIVIC